MLFLGRYRLRLPSFCLASPEPSLVCHSSSLHLLKFWYPLTSSKDMNHWPWQVECYLLRFILARLLVGRVIATALLVFLRHELRFTGGPLARLAAFVALLNLLFYLIMQLRVGVLVSGRPCRGSQGRERNTRGRQSVKIMGVESSTTT